jgi:hypothetical protein
MHPLNHPTLVPLVIISLIISQRTSTDCIKSKTSITMSGIGRGRSRHGRGPQLSRSNSEGNNPSKGHKRGKLVDRSRQVSAFGQAFVDNPDSLSADLVASVAGKALRLKITLINQITGQDANYFGQAGLIRGERLTASPVQKRQAVGDHRLVAGPRVARYRATPVTALHNVVTDKNNAGELEVFQHATLASSDHNVLTIRNWSQAGVDADTLDEFAIRPGDQNGEGYIAWDAHDVDTAGEIANERSAFTEKNRTFQLVRDDFSFAVGQKIGLAVYRDFVISAESTGIADMTEDEIKKVYGEMNKVNIYAGEITRVCDGGLCFEHNVNNFDGCSGAIVFLLDKHQDLGSGVTEEDDGKAIAVHVGGDEVGGGLMRNFAFKIHP